MESQMTVVSGEFVTGEAEGVISLSRKISVFNKILTKFGYTNIAIQQVLFRYKSRCSDKSEGTMNLRLVDRRLDDPADQLIDGLKFDIKDWITFTWAYPCWFHYKDFEAKDKDLIEIEWDVLGSNMISAVSLGNYKVKIVYRMQNDITVIRMAPNVASKTHSQAKSERFVKKSKMGRKSKSQGDMLNISLDTPNNEPKGSEDYEERKRELLAKSTGSLFVKRGIPIMN